MTVLVADSFVWRVEVAWFGTVGAKSMVRVATFAPNVRSQPPRGLTSRLKYA